MTSKIMDGQPVIAAIEMNNGKRGGEYTINIKPGGETKRVKTPPAHPVNSAYPKDLEGIAHWIASGSMRYWDKAQSSSADKYPPGFNMALAVGARNMGGRVDLEQVQKLIGPSGGTDAPIAPVPQTAQTTKPTVGPSAGDVNPNNGRKVLGSRKGNTALGDLRVARANDADEVVDNILKELAPDHHGATCCRALWSNFGDTPTKRIAELIDHHLGGHYAVDYTDVFSAMPEAKDYNYASDQLNRPQIAAHPSFSGTANSLRDAATADLRAEIDKLVKPTGDQPAETRDSRSGIEVARPPEPAGRHGDRSEEGVGSSIRRAIHYGQKEQLTSLSGRMFGLS